MDEYEKLRLSAFNNASICQKLWLKDRNNNIIIVSEPTNLELEMTKAQKKVIIDRLLEDDDA